MSSYKGNDGNLMQHWILCELLTVARKHTANLTFVDAHSMAHIATHRLEKKTIRKCRFDLVEENLPGQGSAYEQAWQALSPDREGYPNSANFVRHIWCSQDACSMLLCERDESTVALLREWREQHSDLAVEIASGDWRERFDRALPQQEGLVLISFDPDMFNRNQRKVNPRNMYPTDLDKVLSATSAYPKNMLLQLSTYSTNDGNDQDRVAECIRPTLEAGGFEELAVVKASATMMSLLYQRRVDFFSELVSLPSRFRNWLDAIKPNL